MKNKTLGAIKIPVQSITDPRLAARDLRVLALLIFNAGDRTYTVSSQVKMARILRCSRGTIQHSLNRLGAAGYIKRRNKTKIGRKVSHHPFSAHSYHLLWLAKSA